MYICIYMYIYIYIHYIPVSFRAAKACSSSKISAGRAGYNKHSNNNSTNNSNNDTMY